jgi:hypothetical protein
LLDGEDAKNKFCRNALHVQILYQNVFGKWHIICQPLQEFYTLLITYFHGLFLAHVSQNHYVYLLQSLQSGIIISWG